MTIYQGFLGPTNALASPSVDSEVTRNWFLESTAPGTGNGPVWLAPAPGFEHFVVLPNGPVRGLFFQNGRCFAVGGLYFCELFANHTFVIRSTVFNDGRPVWMSSNGTAGNQLAFASGGVGYLYHLDTNVLDIIADPDFPTPCSMMGFVDGFFLALKESTNQFSWSALEDGSVWDPLDVFQLSQSSDAIQTLIPVHGQVWLLGSQTSVVISDTGGATVFAPITGSLMQQGTCAAYSAWAGDNALYWLGGNEYGQAVVYRGTGVGAQPDRVSTYAVEFALNNAPTLVDTMGWGYQENGHTFYVLYVPTLPTTWVYDISMNAWHERSLWDPVAMRDIPDIGRCHTFAFGHHLIGDRQGAAVYRQDFNLATCSVVQSGP